MTPTNENWLSVFWTFWVLLPSYFHWYCYVSRLATTGKLIDGDDDDDNFFDDDWTWNSDRKPG